MVWWWQTMAVASWFESWYMQWYGIKIFKKWCLVIFKIASIFFFFLLTVHFTVSRVNKNLFFSSAGKNILCNESFISDFEEQQKECQNYTKKLNSYIKYADLSVPAGIELLWNFKSYQAPLTLRILQNHSPLMHILISLSRRQINKFK